MLLEEIGVLVVDDVSSMRLQIKELLNSMGLKKVSVASNGEEAKVILDLEPILLVLADWHMEPTDGIDLLRYIRTHPQHKKTFFIMVTAECTKDSVIQAVNAGVDGYIVKPLTVAQVQTKVLSVLVSKKVLA